MSIESVKITKGGKLIAEVFTKEGPKEEDVSAELYDQLFRTCHIEEGVVLKDVLLLVKDWCEILSPLTTSSPTWLKELVDEGLNSPYKAEGDNVKHLEVSWQSEVTQYGKEPKQINEWVSFDGIGEPPVGDESYKDWPVGKPVHYALEFSPVHTLSELPLKLNTMMKLRDETSRKAVYPAPILVEAEKDFTLIDILRGIFWELSFFGSPTNRDTKSDELTKSMDDIKSGKVKTIPLEEIKSKWAKLLDEDDDKDKS